MPRKSQPPPMSEEEINRQSQQAHSEAIHNREEDVRRILRPGDTDVRFRYPWLSLENHQGANVQTRDVLNVYDDPYGGARVDTPGQHTQQSVSRTPIAVDPRDLERLKEQRFKENQTKSLYQIFHNQQKQINILSKQLKMLVKAIGTYPEDPYEDEDPDYVDPQPTPDGWGDIGVEAEYQDQNNAQVAKARNHLHRQWDSNFDIDRHVNAYTEVPAYHGDLVYEGDLDRIEDDFADHVSHVEEMENEGNYDVDDYEEDED